MKNAFLACFSLFMIFVLAGCSRPPAEEKSPIDSPENETSNSTLSEELSHDIKSSEDRKTNNTDQTQTMKESNPTGISLLEKYDSAIMKTNMGDIKIEFFSDDSPATVNNFLKLADKKFYDGTKFHRVIKGFMIQGGDPLSKDNDPENDGTGGPGYVFKDEFNSRKLVRGSLAMANSGPNTNGSQFFIVTAESTPWLDGKHTNFGKVVEGMDVVDKIENIQTGLNDHPEQDIAVVSIELIEK